MIEFIFRINHPRPNDRTEQKDYVLWDKRLSKNWAAELELLSEMSTYSEADDTAVREAVYAALKEFFVLPVFKSVRA